MKIAFLGTSHAAQHLSAAAAQKGFKLCLPEAADVIFVSEDTPTNEAGERHLEPIIALVWEAINRSENATPIVLTSAVPPGFTRGLRVPGIWHQAETLRIRDAEERAARPEMLIVGGPDPAPPFLRSFEGLPAAYVTYLRAFRCPVLRMTWEEAEFAKVAINAFLATQVDTTNMLAAAAARVGANWSRVSEALALDSRIGPKAYLSPGDWRRSRHLLRDHVTLQRIQEKS